MNYNRTISLLAVTLSTVLVCENSELSPPLFQGAEAEDPICVDFIPSNTTIRLACGSAMLTDIYEVVKKNKAAIGGFEGTLEKESTNGIWLLRSNLVISNNSSLTVNATDTKWLKIYSDGKQAYSIKAYGNMNIDSVRITSWDPEENDYRVGESHGLPPRPFIVVKEEGIGTTNVTDSELAYLGYGAVQSHGLSFYGGNGSIVRGNNIHHLEMGLYSDGVDGILIENNHIHHNKAYGLDPHSGSRNMIIRNNVVNDNGHIGIICSGHCRNILIEGNKVYNNSGTAVVLSIDMRNSVARHNHIHDSNAGLVIAKSDNNKVYGNRIWSSEDGIKVMDNSSNNYIFDNIFSAIDNYAILVRGTDVLNNTFENNVIDNSTKGVRLHNNSDSLFINNHLVDINSAGREYLVQANSTLNLESTKFPLKSKITSDNSPNNIINIANSGTIKIKDGMGKITDFDTETIPFSSRLYDETFSVISSNSTFAKMR